MREERLEEIREMREGGLEEMISFSRCPLGINNGHS